MRFFFSDPIWASQPSVDALRPQSHGVGRALLGINSLTLREVLIEKIRVSTGAVRIIASRRNLSFCHLIVRNIKLAGRNVVFVRQLLEPCPRGGDGSLLEPMLVTPCSARQSYFAGSA